MCVLTAFALAQSVASFYRSVRMPQLHTSLHFHLTPIVMINGSSRRDLLLNSQNFCRSIPAGTENPSLCSRISKLQFERFKPTRLLNHQVRAHIGCGSNQLHQTARLLSFGSPSSADSGAGKLRSKRGRIDFLYENFRPFGRLKTNLDEKRGFEGCDPCTQPCSL
ncbi:UNVERIFIED_CONTAM: hypothetical protein Scaly_3075500 [Sesamum calycinum]|uniref:Uncharacterized protein n=1 Tax=Sesamum calycinum TaxID=2727403 RepID=A0AAW2JX00_9LAMI